MLCKKTKLKIKENDDVSPPLHPSDQWIPIGTGNYYKGKWNYRTMSGNGVYVMPDGTVYKGNFDDGLFHGRGTAYHPSGSRIEGIWEKGECIERNYIFSNGLRFHPNNWQYCKMPDRRYAIEYINGLEPASKSRITNRHPMIKVPDGAYDAGDGFYYPLTNTVHNYWTNALIRVPTAEGAKWIMKNCIQGGNRVIGYRPEIYEDWYKSTEYLWSDPDYVNSELMLYKEKCIITHVKSVPSSMLDFSLQALRLLWDANKVEYTL